MKGSKSGVGGSISGGGRCPWPRNFLVRSPRGTPGDHTATTRPSSQSQTRARTDVAEMTPGAGKMGENSLQPQTSAQRLRRRIGGFSKWQQKLRTGSTHLASLKRMTVRDFSTATGSWSFSNRLSSALSSLPLFLV